ncbi:hypothetical protein M3Y98_01171200 [Aphelenchoides besseyi]|nr:hypothetical protein M3Y98_01170200 [Aphelenchoides besseyi]KAI6174262.1 hypothetical protein M3Y98_01171200 [Aphelenchoides besseyi]
MFSEVGVLVFNTVFGGMMTYFSIGSSQQQFSVLFDFTTVPLLVTAEDCGIRRNDCPRMCNYEAIAHLYCDPLCFPISKAMYYAYCRDSFRSSNSTTYKRLKGTWKERLQCCKDPLYGRFASDIFQFGEFLETPELELEFVEGTLMQYQAFPSYNGLIGLGFQDSSGHVGLVEQLYQQKVIREPIISFSPPLVVLGTLDSQHCDSWSHFPVISDALGWTFEVERVELFGVSISSRNMYLEVPRDVKQRLIELGIVTDCYRPTLFWCVREDTDKTFAIHVRDHVYSQDISSVHKCVEYANQSICTVCTVDVEYPRSNGQNSWLLPLIWIMQSGLLALDLLA